MKKLLLFIVITMLTAISVSAQISKGSSYLGGNISFYDQKGKNDLGTNRQRNTNLDVSPSIGFAYRENRVWGLTLNYSYQRSENGGSSKEDGFGVGGFLRQYKPLGKGFYLFMLEDLFIRYAHGYVSNSFPESYKTKVYQTGASFAPGFAYDMSKRFQLELSLNGLFYANYAHSKREFASSSTLGAPTEVNTFNVGTSLSRLADLGNISIGARFVFGR